MQELVKLSPEHVKDPMSLHRFVDDMSDLFHSAIQRIASEYSENAAMIWKGKPSSADFVYRFLRLKV
jgi:hypothetical protein